MKYLYGVVLNSKIEEDYLLVKCITVAGKLYPCLINISNLGRLKKFFKLKEDTKFVNSKNIAFQQYWNESDGDRVLIELNDFNYIITTVYKNNYENIAYSQHINNIGTSPDKITDKEYFYFINNLSLYIKVNEVIDTNNKQIKDELDKFIIQAGTNSDLYIEYTSGNVLSIIANNTDVELSTDKNVNLNVNGNINLNANNLIVNGDNDYLVKYSELANMINTIQNTFNNHTHIGNNGSPTSNPMTSQPPSMLNLPIANMMLNYFKVQK